jgi:hypothetical protein
MHGSIHPAIHPRKITSFPSRTKIRLADRRQDTRMEVKWMNDEWTRRNLSLRESGKVANDM